MSTCSVLPGALLFCASQKLKKVEIAAKNVEKSPPSGIMKPSHIPQENMEERTMRKRFLSLLLVLACVLTLAAVPVIAAEPDPVQSPGVTGEPAAPTGDPIAPTGKPEHM